MMLVGAVHEVPLYVMAFPLKSTAMQNDADGHDTRESCFPLSMLTGALHELPLYVSAFPLKSTATQKDADGQDTDSRKKLDGSIFAGALHELPL